MFSCRAVSSSSFVVGRVNSTLTCVGSPERREPGEDVSSRTRPTARQKIKTKTRKEVASKKTRFRLPQTRGPAVHIGDDSVWRGPLQPQDTALRRESGSLNVPQRPKRSRIPGCLLSMTGERDSKDHDRGPESVHEDKRLRSVEWAGGLSGAILHFFDISFFVSFPFFLFFLSSSCSWQASGKDRTLVVVVERAFPSKHQG